MLPPGSDVAGNESGAPAMTLTVYAIGPTLALVLSVTETLSVTV